MAGITVDPNRVIDVYKSKFSEATDENILLTAAANQLSAQVESLQTEVDRLNKLLETETEPNPQG